MVGRRHGWLSSWLVTVMVGRRHVWSSSWLVIVVVGRQCWLVGRLDSSSSCGGFGI